MARNITHPDNKAGVAIDALADWLNDRPKGGVGTNQENLDTHGMYCLRGISTILGEQHEDWCERNNWPEESGWDPDDPEAPGLPDDLFEESE